MEEKLTKAQKILVDFHQKFELFKGMNTKELLAVVEKVRFIKLEKDEKIFQKGHTGKEFFYIIDGSVSILVDGNLRVALLNRKTFFGEMAFITKKPRNASAFVESDQATLLVINIKDTVEPTEPEAFSKLYKNISEVLVDKVEEMNRKLTIL
ncbi:cyclic nucleotide-binding protein [Thiovulum sp. ES]|nr:cyclic nucleotide-binding protein [Thiovulum sp. ES]